MPYIDVDITVDEFLWNCSDSEIKKIISILIEDGHLPKNISQLEKREEVENKKTNSELDFSKKLDELKNKFFSLIKEDEEYLEKLFNKYL